MITFHEALKTVQAAPQKLKKENIDLENCLNRVLAEDVCSDLSLPPFNKSAMDGYACRKEDLHENLEVIETIAAGDTPQKSIGRKQCSKIMTGAMVPEGADTVIMVEHTEELTKNHIRFTKEKSKSNICLKGEDVIKGDVVLKKGTRIKAQHISVLASVGCANPLVYKQPIVSSIATGSELVEPNTNPSLSQIRNVNSWQLQAQLQKIGIQCKYKGIAKDSKEETQKLMEESITESDVLMISGGVSVGDYDYVPQILKELGFNIWFHTLSVKPGKHTIFATKDDKYVFAMPGNPVSSFVQFELLGKPLLFRLMGHHYEAPMVRMPIAETYKRKKTDRLAFVPVRFNANNQVVPVNYHGSAHINAYSFADGIMAVPNEVDEFMEGEFVHVRPL
jgi:molybdopterin molybdotransferase